MLTKARKQNETTVKRSGRNGTARIEPLQDARRERSVHVLVVGEKGYHKRVVDALAAADIPLIDRAATESDLFDKLQHEEFDCLIADRTAYGNNSIELRELIEQRIPRPPAMIMLTDVSNRNVILKAFRSGFSDFVSTDHDFARELVQAVHRSVGHNRRAQVLIDENEHLSTLAHYDRLTGVPNRSFLEERLATLHAGAKRHTDTFALLLIDIANFETIRDIHGHAIGDQVLRIFARRLVAAARASDTSGRFGGSQFLYLMDRDVSFATVEQACARFVGALSFAVELENARVALSAGIGGALFPFDGTTIDDLLSAAKQALDIAKANASGYHLTHHAEPASADASQATAAIADTERSIATVATRAMNGKTGDDRLEDRRREHRDRVLFRGRIILDGGFSTIDCVIRDLSSHGARVTVTGHAVIPRMLSFAVLDTGRTFDAIRRWQRGHSIGLEFSVDGEEEGRGTQPLASDPDEPQS
jgi:diguanylate cyclase (GGDEF)-like protein